MMQENSVTEQNIPLFIYGNEQTNFAPHRRIAPFIKKQKLGMGQNCDLFMTVKDNFPVMAIGKGSEDSYVTGECVWVTMEGLKSQKRAYKKMFPAAEMMRIKLRYVHIKDLSKRGLQADTIEQTAFTFGLPFKKALSFVKNGELRYSSNNAYKAELSDLGQGKNPRRTIKRIPIIEKEEE